MYRLAALLGLFLLTACAATPVQPTVQAEACHTITATALNKQLTDHGGSVKADYKGAEAAAFNQFLTEHVVDKGPESEFDEIIVWVREKAAILVWFYHGCAIAHVTGPSSALEPYIGRSA